MAWNNLATKALFLLSFSFISFSMAFAQSSKKDINYGNQQWLQYYNKLKISKRFTLLHDGSFRTKNAFRNYSLILLRTGCGYSVSENISVAAGIAFTFSFTDNRFSKAEFRGWQEVLFPLQLKRFYFSNRIRLEERYFRKITDGRFSADDNFNYRARYRLYVSIPLNHKSITTKTISVNLGDEVLINFGKDIVYNTFDSNRLLGGLSYQFNTNWSVTLNYMAQFSKNSIPDSFEQNDIMWLSFTHSISKVKKIAD